MPTKQNKEEEKMSNLFRYFFITTFASVIVCILFSVISSNNVDSKQSNQEGMTSRLVRVDFEVFGLVQGVFFRKNTLDQAVKLGVKGWCKNTPQGTVQGQAEGPEDKVNIMKDWLRNTGSPQSRIDKTEFKNEKNIEKYEFENFNIVRKPRA